MKKSAKNQRKAYYRSGYQDEIMVQLLDRSKFEKALGIEDEQWKDKNDEREH